MPKKRKKATRRKSSAKPSKDVSQKDTTLTKAPILDKFLAFIIDMIIVYLSFNIAMSIIVPFSFPEFLMAADAAQIQRMLVYDPGLQIRAYLLMVALAVVSIFYFALFEWHIGSTPGKRIFKLKVLSLDKKAKVRFTQTFARNAQLVAITSMSLAIPLFALIDALAQFWYPDNERLLDRMTRTMVRKEVRV